jgi:calcineurin-like phosphoesterase family protein
MVDDIAHIPDPLLSLDWWVISDTHFFHDNIIKYQNRPVNHDDLMLTNWLERIGTNDTVLHLGDIGFSKPPYRFEKILNPSLTGIKYLVLGNHDKQSKTWYLKNGWNLVTPFQVLYRGWTILFTHRPGGDWKPYHDDERLVRKTFKTINVHGHIHSLELENRRLINLSVERTEYSPVRIRDVLDKRIEELED